MKKTTLILLAVTTLIAGIVFLPSLSPALEATFLTIKLNKALALPLIR